MGEESLAVTLARVEGKLDAYAARTTLVEERVNDLDVRVRDAASVEDLQGLDARLRAQESKQVVTPAALVATLASTVAILGGLVTFVQKVAPM